MAKPDETQERRTLKEVSAGAARQAFRDLRSGESQAFELNHGWHIVNAPLGATPQELDLHPTFFNMISATDPQSPGVHKFDSIRVVADDESWVADFIALRASNGLLVAKLMGHASLPAAFDDGKAKPLPGNWRLRRVKAAEYSGKEGWIAEEKEMLQEGQHKLRRIDSSGQPFNTEQDAYDATLKDPRFRAAAVTHYYS